MDAKLLLFLNSYHTVWLDSFMWRITHTGTWWLVIIGLLYVLFKNNHWRQVLSIVVCMALCILLADQISSSLIKPLVCRLRPTHNPELMNIVHLVHGHRGGLYGFCSSHAANTFSLATFLTLLFRNRNTTICVFTWASLVSFSRIYMAVHYPGDILCGALLGMLVGYVVYLLYRHFLLNDGQKKYYSNAYTPSGYLISDVLVFNFTFVATFLFILIFC